MRIILPEKLETEKGVRLGKRQLGRLEAKGLWPKRVRVSPMCWGYVEAEVDAVLAARAAERQP